jgi:hypothetical protein
MFPNGRKFSSSVEEFSTLFSTPTLYDILLLVVLQLHHMDKLLQKTNADRRKIETAENIPETLTV